jgi:hypothetical protein
MRAVIGGSLSSCACGVKEIIAYAKNEEAEVVAGPGEGFLI